MTVVLRTTEEQLAAVGAEQARLAKEEDALRRVRSGLIELLNLTGGPPPGPRTESGAPNARPNFPRGARAVREVLLAQANSELTVSEVVDELVSRGWGTPSESLVNSTRTNLSRAVQQYAEVVRPRPGVFMYQDPSIAETPTAVGGPRSPGPAAPGSGASVRTGAPSVPSDAS